MLKRSLILMILAEGLSFVAFLYPFLSLPLLALAGVAVFFIALKNPDLSIFILFGELFVGSRGHLLEYNLGPVAISLRLVIFVAVFLGWIIGEIQKSKFKNHFIELPKTYWLLIAVIGLGMVIGYLDHNGLSNVFLDANGYMYLLILPVVISTIKTRQQVKGLLDILAAAILVIAAKTLLLFVWFAYSLPGVSGLYHWVLALDTGEITGILGSASRIFMQSQFYSLVGLLIFVFLPNKRRLVVGAGLLAIIIGLSRSFWLGLGFAGLFAAVVWLFYLGWGWRRLGKLGIQVLLIATLEIGLLYGITQTAGGAFSEAVTSRAANPVQEAAGGARLLLLPQLLGEIQEAPLLGKGFGEMVTYKSYLPDRMRPDNPEGEIRSFAFEWGYLDIWLKLGGIGLIIYLLLIARIFRAGWQGLSAVDTRPLILGLLCGLVALVALNITTPYLNHPLGIGYLILCLAAFKVYGSENPAPVAVTTVPLLHARRGE